MSSIVLTSLFTQFAAISLDKQLCVADLLGENHTWSVDLASGTLQFDTDTQGEPSARSERLTCQAQVLGTESTTDHTWLWGWANEDSSIPTSLLHYSNDLKAYGESHGIEEFLEPELLLSDTVNGTWLATIAIGLLNADFYYRCPYDDGALFVLVTDSSFRCGTSDPLHRITSVFPQLVAHVAVNHRTAFLSYLNYYNLTIIDDGRRVTGSMLSGQRVTAVFDSLDRLIDLQVMLQ